MLFNMEMIEGFFKNFEKSSVIAEKDWRISHLKLADGREEKDPSALYIGTDGQGRVFCRSGESRILFRGTDVPTVFNLLADRMDYYNRWEAKALSTLHNREGSLERFALLAELFPDYLVKVVNSRGKFLFSSDGDESPYIDSRYITIIRSIPACYNISIGNRGLTVYWEREHYQKNVLFGNIVFSDNSYVMFSVIERDKPLSDSETHLAELAQGIFEKMEFTSELKTVIEPYERTMTSLINGENVPESMLRGLETIWNSRIANGACLVMICNNSYQKYGSRAMISSINDQIPSAYAFSYDKRVLCLLPFDKLYHNCGILEKLTEATGSEITFSTSFNAWPEIRMIYRNMNEIRTRLAQRGHNRRVIYCADYILDYYLWTLDGQNAGKLLHPDIVRLRALGDGNKFLDTYYCFLANNCKMAVTAQKLDIHLSTLKYRMEKINSTVSLDPEDYRARMAFLLSCDLQKEAGHHAEEKENTV